jgi:hypothetical protein
LFADIASKSFCPINFTENINGSVAFIIYSNVPVDANMRGVACGRYLTDTPSPLLYVTFQN